MLPFHSFHDCHLQASRSPCCVLLALSWNTNENPSTDKLSRESGIPGRKIANNQNQMSLFSIALCEIETEERGAVKNYLADFFH